MPSTRSTRKRQTRLLFEPVVSSSPEASKLSTTVQSRAAAVRYEGSRNPSKKRRLEIEDSIASDEEPDRASSPASIGHLTELVKLSKQGRKYKQDNGGSSLPTPEKSSQIAVRDRKRQSKSLVFPSQHILPKAVRNLVSISMVSL